MNDKDRIDMVEGLIYWPMCPIKNCKNRICLALNSKYCHPHTFDEGMKNIKQKESEVTR